MIEQLHAAAEALNCGDPVPFAALIAEEGEWRGVSRGHLWWRRTPACHGPGEVLAVLGHQLGSRRERLELRPEFTVLGDTIIGSTRWLGADGRRHERFQVLTIRDGKIVDMQGCASRRAAERFARDRSSGCSPA